MELFLVGLAVLAIAAAVVCAARWKSTAAALGGHERTIEADRAEIARITSIANERGTKAEIAEANLRNAEARAGELRAERDAARQELETVRSQLSKLDIEFGRVNETLTQERKQTQEKIEALNDIRAQIETKLQLMSKQMLQETSEQFVKRAKEVFEAQNKEAKEGLEVLVKPIGESLKEYQTKLQEMEQGRKKDEGELVQQLRSVAETHVRLHDTTSNLVNALRSAPKTTGRWGEKQFQKMIELAGMLEHVDFIAEKSAEMDTGRQRPDFIVKLPGGQNLIVDIKTPIKAYLEAVDAENDEIREAKLIEHSNQVRHHSTQLGSREYWKSFNDNAEFVVMFIPGDNFFSAAVQRDPTIFDDAYNKRVVITTPTTFLALAKAISFGWRQEKASREAAQIHSLATELYKRLVQMGGNVMNLTKALNKTVEVHNTFIGNLERTVLPQARKFTELSISDAYGEIPALDTVESEARTPHGRDLILEDKTQAAE